MNRTTFFLYVLCASSCAQATLYLEKDDELPLEERLFIYASKTGDRKTIEILMEEDTNPHCIDYHTRLTALKLAREKSHHELANTIELYGFTFSKRIQAAKPYNPTPPNRFRPLK